MTDSMAIHHHTLQSFFFEEIERAQERVARSFGLNVIRHRHELYGLCPRARGIKGGSCPGRAEDIVPPGEVA